MKIKMILTGSILLSLLSINSANANNINEKCYNYYTAQEIEYIIRESDPNDLDLTCSNGTIYTSQKNYDDLHLNENVPMPTYFTAQLNVPTFKQEENYYCGYASVKEVLQHINGTSKSQSTYASEMGTSGSSAVVYKIKNLLNNYISSPKYTYSLGRNYTLDTFKSLVENNIANNRPIIMHAKANYLTLYQNASFDIWHYYVIDGHTITGNEDNVKYIYYVDSWEANYGSGNTLGSHQDLTINALNSVQTTESSRYIIHS